MGLWQMVPVETRRKAVGLLIVILGAVGWFLAAYFAAKH
jgi:hypothetical protein